MADFDLGDGLRKVLLAGIGALATGVEKGQEIVDNLVKKGELTVDQGKILNTELKRNRAQAARSGSQATAGQGGPSAPAAPEASRPVPPTPSEPSTPPAPAPTGPVDPSPLDRAATAGPDAPDNPERDSNTDPTGNPAV